MNRFLSFLMTSILCSLPLAAADEEKEAQRLNNCGTVLKEVLNVPENIPRDLLDKAECVIVYPSVLKAAFIVGGSYGRGAMTCRTGKNFTGPWSAPSMMALEAGGVGLQIGGEATDFIFLVMNDRGAHSILSSKVKLGADAAAAAGPKGRDTQAATDVTLRAEILTYSRSRGLFAGISLEGSTVRPDGEANERVYHKKISAEDIVFKREVTVPPAAHSMTSYLDQKAHRNQSASKKKT